MAKSGKDKILNLERSFRQGERNFGLLVLVEGITDYAICKLDAAGNVTNWNAGAERITGYKAKQILGKHFSIFYTPEDREGTVLLVEGNPEVADASTGLLEQLEYAVRWVSDAETPVAEIERDGIDLVFSDTVMPGKMDGVKLARAIRKMQPELPVLLTTGYSDSARDVRTDFPVLKKPCQLRELSVELSKLTQG